MLEFAILVFPEYNIDKTRPLQTQIPRLDYLVDVNYFDNAYYSNYSPIKIIIVSLKLIFYGGYAPSARFVLRTANIFIVKAARSATAAKRRNPNPHPGLRDLK